MYGDPIDEETLYYIEHYPDYYSTEDLLGYLAQTTADVRAVVLATLLKRRDPAGRLFTWDDVIYLDDSGKVLQKRPKELYVYIYPLDDEERERALYMNEGDQTARSITSDYGFLTVPLGTIKSHLGGRWKQALFLTKEEMLLRQGPCVHVGCHQPKQNVTLDLCDNCYAQLKAMENDEWTTEAFAMFYEFTVPKWKRGEL